MKNTILNYTIIGKNLDLSAHFPGEPKWPSPSCWGTSASTRRKWSTTWRPTWTPWSTLSLAKCSNPRPNPALELLSACRWAWTAPSIPCKWLATLPELPLDSRKSWPSCQCPRRAIRWPQIASPQLCKRWNLAWTRRCWPWSYVEMGKKMLSICYQMSPCIIQQPSLKPSKRSFVYFWPNPLDLKRWTACNKSLFSSSWRSFTN